MRAGAEEAWRQETHSQEGHREFGKAGEAQEVGSGADALAWLAKYRRLTIRYERRDDIYEAFLHLGCSLICLNYLV